MTNGGDIEGGGGVPEGQKGRKPARRAGVTSRVPQMAECQTRGLGGRSS